MKDLEYINTGLFTRFIPNTPAGEDAWRVMAESDGYGAILTIRLVSVLRQIRKTGLTVSKANPVLVNDEELLEELMS